MMVLPSKVSWHQWGARLHQISLLILSVFKEINSLLFPLKSSESHRFSDDFRGNRICLNSPNIISEIGRRSLSNMNI